MSLPIFNWGAKVGQRWNQYEKASTKTEGGRDKRREGEGVGVSESARGSER